MKLAVFAFFAALSTVAGQFSGTTAENRSLRASSSSPDTLPSDGEVEVHHKRVYAQIIIEQVQVTLVGPGDYSSPTEEEAGFVLDSILTAFDIVEGDKGFEGAFAALESVEDRRRQLVGGEDNGRELWRGDGYSWTIDFSGKCNRCRHWDDDDVVWNRKLETDSLSHAERALSRGDGLWETTFCRILQSGEYEVFQSVEKCIFSTNKLLLPGSIRV